MDYLMFARWFGIVSVVLSLGILFNLEDAREMARNMVRTETGYIMGGVLPVIFGTLSLMFVFNFDFNWNSVITIVGIAMLGIGAYRVIFVHHWKAFLSRHIQKIPFLFSLFGLMFGILLLYVGYVAKAVEVTVT